MKKAVILVLISVMQLNLQAQDKKEIKALEKKYGVYDQGVFKKAEQVGLLGTNLRFKLASRQADQTSWKDEMTVKFPAYSMLEGISDKVLQDITNQYQQMVIAKFKALGIEVLPYTAISGAKDYEKMQDKGTSETYTEKTMWGVAKVFTPNGQPYLTWNNAAPFGPQKKIAAQIDALLFNSLVTIDFSDIGVKIEQSGVSHHNAGRRMVYTEGEASVVPHIKIIGHTYNDNALALIEDNTYNFVLDPKGKQHNMKLDLNSGDFTNSVEWASNIEKCSDCEPAFAKSFLKIMENGLGTVVITAEPEAFKKAVLEVLQQYLDETFTLYGLDRN